MFQKKFKLFTVLDPGDQRNLSFFKQQNLVILLHYVQTLEFPKENIAFHIFTIITACIV